LARVCIDIVNRPSIWAILLAQLSDLHTRPYIALHAMYYTRTVIMHRIQIMFLMNTSTRSIFEMPHHRSGRGFLAAVRSDRGMKSACYYICVTAATAMAVRSGRGFSVVVQRKKW
jgi:hypothetical protein